jgi:mannose-1-phosphate guanylyltransferase
VVTGAAGRILSIAGRPRPARGRVSLFTGVHVLDPALLDRLPAGASDSVRDLYAPLVAEGARVLGVRVRGAWYDLGAPAQYLDAQRRMLRRRGLEGVVGRGAQVAGGARVTAAVVGAGCRIARGARVEASVLWEHVTVGAGAVLRRCVIADGVRIAEGERLEGQLVTRSGRRPL